MKVCGLCGVSLVLSVALVGIKGVAFAENTHASENASEPTITVEIYNYSQASPAIRARAEREASRIFSAAGVQTVWRECPVIPPPAGDSSPCQKKLEASDLRLRILPAPPQNKFQDAVFGFAVHPALASIYYDHVQRLAQIDDAEFEIPVILGGVMAHELGHLLLGSDGHSSKGIMQPRWKKNQVRKLMTGDLLFTPEQSRQMGVEAQARMEQQRSNLSSASATPQN
jgi:hypothetical protein